MLRKFRMVAGSCLFLPAIVCLLSLSAWPQDALSTTATEPYRFVAAHGHRAAILGYAGRSLEIWGYPFQILDRYEVDFQIPGSPKVLLGSDRLTRIEVDPDQIVRVWTGPGFMVRETEFVPLDQPDAILRYEITGTQPVDLVMRYRPVMDLMWPASAGGQEVRWSGTLPGYVLSESTDGYSAVLASQQIRSHQPIVNSTRREDLTQTFTLHPVPGAAGASEATLYVALLPPGEAEPAAALQKLRARESAWRDESAAQARAWNADGLSITTPDDAINRALAWAETDLNQAWACDAKIGCGVVAGFGPSRGQRRPQYDWFFGGDGMVATDALLATGHLQRARAELEFILRYQNPSNGMLWHEISQSAGFLDWSRYPYLYEHIDLTFDFLSTLGDYLAATGDTQFLSGHWAAIEAAFHFCQSLIAPDTGLPVIPANKLGANEQERMREDTGLSAAWVGAAAAFSRLAQATGHVDEAKDAAAMSARARGAFAQRYWEAAQHFWIEGYTVSGRAIDEKRSGPSAALAEHLLPAAEENEMLDALAGAAFESDWGTRSLAAGSPGYNPNSYSQGSVSALHTAETAAAFWDADRPLPAWQMWTALVPWIRLDSLGHMHEVLAGDVYQPQVESVPEQTWSSAGFLSAAVRGLVGVDVDAAAGRLTLAPRRFPGGGPVSVAKLRVGGSRVAAAFMWQEQGIDVVLTNDGAPIHLHLAPEMPLGALHLRATVEGKAAHATVEAHGQEEQATLDLLLSTGTTHCHFAYAGGVWVEVPRADPEPGTISSLPHFREVHWDGHNLTVNGDVAAGTAPSFILDTPWQVANVDGGSASRMAGSRTKIVFAPVTAPIGTYQSTTVKIELRP